MNNHPVTLFYAGFFFGVALFFWVMCVRMKKDPRARLLAFWYAVLFEFAGFAALAVDAITNG